MSARQDAVRAAEAQGGLLTAVVILAAAGAVAVFSATAPLAMDQALPPHFLRHGAALLLGAGLIYLTSRVPVAAWRALAGPLYLLSLVALVATLGMGRTAGGAQRWLVIPGVGVGFQPAEIMKLTTVLLLCVLLARKDGRADVTGRQFLVALGLAALPATLCLLQPDLGSAVILCALAGLMLLVAGARVTHLALPALAGTLAVALYIAVRPYAWKRWVGFLDPWERASTEGFQLVQSFVAFGRGGIAGVGVGDGRQKLYYLPEAHNDFILSVVAEETGLIGVLVILGAFIALLIAGLANRPRREGPALASARVRDHGPPDPAGGTERRRRDGLPPDQGPDAALPVLRPHLTPRRVSHGRNPALGRAPGRTSSAEAARMTWIIAGGGTGGHVTPALALGEELRSRGVRTHFIGTDRGIERRLVPENGFELTVLPSRPFVGRGALDRLRALTALAWTSLRAVFVLRRLEARIVVAVGGYASLPPAVAGWLLRRPVVLINPDAEPGLSNRVLSRIATRVFAAFPGSERHFAHPERVVVTGVPLRQSLRDAFADAAAPPERKDPAERHLFAFGGSLGSQQINDALLASTDLLDATHLHIVHQTGPDERDRVAKAWADAGFDAHVVAFEDDMPSRYRWADLVVCRAGATSLAELTLSGRPAILVPLAHVGGGEQAANARALEAAGGAVVFDGAGFDPGAFATTLADLLGDRTRLEAMSAASGGLARPNAVTQVVDACEALTMGGDAWTDRLGQLERIHFVGIGGIGMCGIAELLLVRGHLVTGTDLADGPTVERLRRLGAEVGIGHDAGAVSGADLVVVSSAIRATNPEVVAATEAGIPVIPRAEMLAELMRLQDGIAIAGTHGKTTTTSLTAHILDAAGVDPTVVVGGRVMGTTAPDRTGARLGKGSLMVAEADESDGSFLRLAPVIAVVTNLEPEHMDHYGHPDALDDAFVEFANRLPFWGRVILCVDDVGVQRILPRITRRRTTVGFSAQADWRALDVRADGAGMRFDVTHAGDAVGSVHLPLPGRHNVANALCALAVADEVGVSIDTARASLAGFGGVERRFETKGRTRGIWVVDDYGHHPTEIRATLAAARSAHAGRLVAIFQPHRFSRTRDHFDEFAAAFHDADVLVLTEIYAASEDKLPGIDSATLADAVRDRGHRDVRFISDLDAIPEVLAPELREGDLVLTLGAGSVTHVGPRLLSALAEASP